MEENLKELVAINDQVMLILPLPYVAIYSVHKISLATVLDL